MFINNILAASPFSPAEWFGLPENYSAHGDQVGHMIDVITWFMLALFVGWTIFFIICLFKFWHRRNAKASYHGVKNHASTHLEIGVVIIEAVLLLGFAFPLWAERTDTYDKVLKDNPVRVRAIGFQFGWKYHYAGNDGKFGFIDRALVSGQGDACIDPNDPNGFDDFINGDLKLPVNRPAIVQVTSTDVIHNFSIIPMRIQQDAIPGKDIPMWFTPTKELETYVVCGQLCGSGHGDMKGTLIVQDEKSFNGWAQDMSKKAYEKNKAAYDERQAAAKAAEAAGDSHDDHGH
ncbi:cytochrome c oxidase subunit 2 [Rubritalea squalenifaciens DSM 18772]|uniref:cytochrome-c oxidase n=2 Tax=Rubritalea TaxID=361050 RepID=A0A1M6P767_9BACT|nr:cytochrome c oxidase subunit II [Rubritalea squalenifaciens]SHK03794.1 cytochrome c oxidase subunit 2 [Rubritalea squalenifaciens DSM 18772]